MKLVTILIAVLAAMGPLSTDVYLPGLPAMAIELHSSVSQMQLSMTTAFFSFLAGAIASPLVGLGGSTTIWPLALVILGAHVLAFLFMNVYVSHVEVR